MASVNRPAEVAVARAHDEVPNGAALAAYLGAGIGAFAVGFIVLINEIGVVTVPTLYAPAGGVSGRTTFAALAWLIAWGVLHSRWKGRQLEPGRVRTATLLLIVLGLLGTFPPVWRLF